MSDLARFESEVSLSLQYEARRAEAGGIEAFVEASCLAWQHWFVLCSRGENWLGRKFLVRKAGRWDATSILQPWMLMGRLLAVERSAEGRVFRYCSLNLEQAESIFDSALSDPSAALRFPFPCLDDSGDEWIVPVDRWQGSTGLAASLDGNEEHFRRHSLDILASRLMPGALIYDPACSTGTFIATMAMALPDIRCVGSDISQDMIGFARQRAACPNLRLQQGDAREPCCDDGSCDVVFVRFLNAEVVYRRDAYACFARLRRLLKPGGAMLVFGHTPVLLPLARLSHKWGLRVNSSLARRPGRRELFEFYVLEAVS